jgi:hypothetical protein
MSRASRKARQEDPCSVGELGSRRSLVPGARACGGSAMPQAGLPVAGIGQAGLRRSGVGRRSGFANVARKVRRYSDRAVLGSRRFAGADALGSRRLAGSERLACGDSALPQAGPVACGVAVLDVLQRPPFAPPCPTYLLAVLRPLSTRVSFCRIVATGSFPHRR